MVAKHSNMRRDTQTTTLTGLLAALLLPLATTAEADFTRTIGTCSGGAAFFAGLDDSAALAASTPEACTSACAAQHPRCVSAAWHQSKPVSFSGRRSQCWLSTTCVAPDCCHEGFRTFVAARNASSSSARFLAQLNFEKLSAKQMKPYWRARVDEAIRQDACRGCEPSARPAVDEAYAILYAHVSTRKQRGDYRTGNIVGLTVACRSIRRFDAERPIVVMTVDAASEAELGALAASVPKLRVTRVVELNALPRTRRGHVPASFGSIDLGLEPPHGRQATLSRADREKRRAALDDLRWPIPNLECKRTVENGYVRRATRLGTRHARPRRRPRLEHGTSAEAPRIDRWCVDTGTRRQVLQRLLGWPRRAGRRPGRRRERAAVAAV